MIKNIKSNYQIIVSIVIFSSILFAQIPFYKAIVLMLEFIVVIEVVKMISDFMEKKRLRLRYVIDVFIIFLIRDVVILTTKPQKDYVDISFLLGVIFTFFIFRVLSFKYSPNFKNKKLD